MQIFRCIGKQRGPVVRHHLVYDRVQARLQRRTDRPAAQSKREQIIPFDRKIFERETGIRREQLVEHALRLPVRLHPAGTDGRLDRKSVV